MKSVIRVYEIELTAVGPVFIGSGKTIEKKEYALSEDHHTVAVMDQYKLTDLLSKKGLINKYIQFMLKFSRSDVGRWLENQGIPPEDYLPLVRYEVDYGDAQIDTHSKLEIHEFIKDPYGNPYVPGSSLKGLLRTILLAADIQNNRMNYGKHAQQVMHPESRNTSRKWYLSKEVNNLEAQSFRTLRRPETKPQDAVNDILSGFVISDSEPLNTDDLVLCKPVALHPDGAEKSMNILRETLKPGTRIKFRLSVDSSLCSITKKEIEDAVEMFSDLYYETFLKAFPYMDRPDEDHIWLGGGTGFLSKTVVYPLLGKEQGIKQTMNIFKNTGVPKEHGHNRDISLGVSPHVCKIAYYDSEPCQMGMCRLKIYEI